MGKLLNLMQSVQQVREASRGVWNLGSRSDLPEFLSEFCHFQLCDLGKYNFNLLTSSFLVFKWEIKIVHFQPHLPGLPETRS